MRKVSWAVFAPVTAVLLALTAYVPASWSGQERGGTPHGAAPQRGGPPAAQHQAEHGVGNGHIPAHGPAPSRPPAHRAEPNRVGGEPAARRSYRDQEGHPEAPHVHAENDRWVGHEGHDPHYHLDHPWEHGHFPQAIGAHHIWRLHGGRPDRFEISGFFFSVAPYDVGFCGDWLWDSDDIVLYDDSDDAGWYLAYNVRLGTYCHVMYLGQ